MYDIHEIFGYFDQLCCSVKRQTCMCFSNLLIKCGPLLIHPPTQKEADDPSTLFPASLRGPFCHIHGCFSMLQYNLDFASPIPLCGKMMFSVSFVKFGIFLTPLSFPRGRHIWQSEAPLRPHQQSHTYYRLIFLESAFLPSSEPPTNSTLIFRCR